uniref:Uncharacterized protein n=1 Tax=Anguilla anguilla TaxID=7936 RepID=A0A0E9UWB6_ANGAN
MMMRLGHSAQQCLPFSYH